LGRPVAHLLLLRDLTVLFPSLPKGTAR
jgi:hypothetical protein